MADLDTIGMKPAARPSGSEPGAGRERRIAIIGTAGRRDDAPRMTPAHFDHMVAVSRNIVLDRGISAAVSGGAAWADHTVVALGLEGTIRPDRIVLHLPAPFDRTKNRFVEKPELGRMDPGRTANYYHDMFSRTLGRNTLAEIGQLARLGATMNESAAGNFKSRNTLVARDMRTGDALLAFTFGSSPQWEQHVSRPTELASLSGVKDGGTADTWNKSQLADKIHMTLGDRVPPVLQPPAQDRKPARHEPAQPARPAQSARPDAGYTPVHIDHVAPITETVRTKLQRKGGYIDNGILSNTSTVSRPIPFRDVTYDSVEAMYVARKNPDHLVNGKPFYRHVADWTAANPGRNPKHLGSRKSGVPQTPDWNSRAIGVMLQAVSHKFAHGTPEAEWLVKQRPDDLKEWNNWGDRRWGMALDPTGTTAHGANLLGEVLTVARARLLQGKQPIPIDETTEKSQHEWLLRYVMTKRGQSIEPEKPPGAEPKPAAVRPAMPVAAARSRRRDNGLD